MTCSGSISWKHQSDGVNWVVLAAGRGKRLNPLTNVHQKTMLQFHGQPFLSYGLSQLACVFDRCRDTLTIVIGYHGEQVQGFFGTEWQGMPIRYAHQSEQRGTGHAIYMAHTSLRFDGPVVCWLGDVFFTADMLQTVRAREFDALTYIAPEDTDELAAAPLIVDREAEVVVEIPWDFAEGEVVGNAACIGLWRLEPETIELMPEVNVRGEWRMVRGLARRMKEGAKVDAVRSPEWIHLGNTPSTFDRMQRVSSRLADLP